MPRSRWSVLATAVVAAAGFTAFPAVTAHADAVRHCVTRAVPVKADMTPAAAPVKPVCYSSFRTAIAVATGGRVQDAPENPAATLNDKSFEAKMNAPFTARPGVSPMAGYVLGISYWNLNFRGSTYTVTDGAPCRNGDRKGVSYVGDAWNDEITSFRVFSQCFSTHYELANYNDVDYCCPVQYGPVRVDISWIGDLMNDETSSILFTKPY